MSGDIGKGPLQRATALQVTLSLLLVVGGRFWAASAEAPDPPPLTAEEFTNVLGKRHVFTKFYAPWCGHCKSLAPTWASLSEIFEPENKEVVIARVNADEEKELASKFGVRGFPTIILFPKGWKEGDEPVPYKGGRQLEQLVNFVNEQTGTMRLTDGSVRGRVPRVDELIGKVGCQGLDLGVCAKSMSEHLAAEGIAWQFAQERDWDQRFINYYTRVLSRMTDGKAKDLSWITTELKRLGGIIAKHENVDKDAFQFMKARETILHHFNDVFEAALKKPATPIEAKKEAKKEEVKQEEAKKEEVKEEKIPTPTPIPAPPQHGGEL